MSDGTRQTILVTGGAGFIGSHLVEALLKHGTKRVIVLDNYFTVSRDNTDNHFAGAEYIQGHTKDVAELVHVAPDVIYHLGEYPRTEESFREPHTVWDRNLTGTAAVLEFWREHKSKLVYAGSSTKFADRGQGRDQSPYAWSKATNTDLIRNYGDWFGLPWAIAYFYNVYGGREIGEGKYATLIAKFKARMRDGLPLEVTKPGIQTRTFTHVDDIVAGLLLVGDQGVNNEYGLGAEESYSVTEIAQLFGGTIVEVERRPGNRIESGVPDLTTSTALGWRATRRVEDHIREFLETLGRKS